MCATYVPPKGPTTMWFIAHTGTPGSEHVISIDFAAALESLPTQDRDLEPEYERLEMPLPPPHNSEYYPPLAPPPSPIKRVRFQPIATLQDCEAWIAMQTRIPSPAPSPVGSASTETTVDGDLMCPPSKGGRIQHTLLTDDIILKSVDVYGTRWRRIAKEMGGRAAGWSDDVVRNRYLRIIDTLGIEPPPKPPRRIRKRDSETRYARWGSEDDQFLHDAIELYQDSATGRVPWGSVAFAFSGRRTRQAIRNRASRLGIVYAN